MKEIELKLFLIGMPGAGKSYWGQRLKKKLKIAAYDLDNLVEMMEEKSVKEIFEEDGEEAFRRAEAKMLRLFKEKKNYIISVGGGTPCFHDNMQWMNKQGVTVFIDEPMDVLVERVLSSQDSRPLLAGKSEEQVREYLEKTYADRIEYYNQAAHRVTGADLEKNTVDYLIAAYA